MLASGFTHGYGRQDLSVRARQYVVLQWGGSIGTMLSGFGPKAVELNLINQEDLRNQEEAWRDWIKSDEGWFSLLNGEVVCRKG
jgi:hypothetical protein